MDHNIIIALGFGGWAGVLLIWTVLACREWAILRRRNRRKRGPDAVQRQAHEIVRAARETGAEWIWEAK